MTRTFGWSAVFLLMLMGCVGLGDGITPPSTIALHLLPYGGCAELGEGGVDCWGRDIGRFGELGAHPVAVSIGPFSELALSNAGLASLYCTTDAAGAVACGGSLVRGHDEGVTIGSYPTAVTAAPPLGRLVVSETGACGLAADGAAFCWGSWDGGLRGTGAPVPDPRPAASLVATAVTGGLHFEELVRGRDAVCGRTAEGSVYCWGGIPMIGGDTVALDSAAACGLAWFTKCANAPRQVSLPAPVIAISAGLYHVCALLSTKSVYCWGSGFGGALGQGDTVSHRAPVLVAGLPSVDLIAAGMDLNCAATSAGQLWCWGNVGGTVVGPTLRANQPAFESIRAGVDHACGRTPEGDVYCWGEGTYGATGVGDTLSHAAPTKVSF